MSEKRILVSACLLGWRCRYDGATKIDRNLISGAKAENRSLVPACPEVLGGLGVPRQPAAIIGGDGHAVLKGKARVLDAQGMDVSKAFILGADRTLDIARRTSCSLAILKEDSPSCGACFIKDVKGNKRKGMGVTAALLSSQNISIESHS